ncbi:hypothetical protein Ddye_022477 [Dipteronia dyeriana]|uniref:DUF4283 domain-containing protein n=1 Tax=Dipteronia dyeriana TaxID=168575 RepID=A0AAD9TS09_9ROSI|nr:hypothetical protein Ddye_022477 [Dipteronia dyeriana]
MGFRLAGKLLTNKTVNREAFISLFPRGPWSFDRALLVLEEPTGKGDIHGMKFNKVAFWVQIHNVPMICMTTEIGRFLGNMIGEVKEVDTGKSGDFLGVLPLNNTVRLELDHLVSSEDRRVETRDSVVKVVSEMGMEDSVDVRVSGDREGSID